MKLEDLRQQLASDATVALAEKEAEVARKEKVIRDLIQQLQEKDKIIKVHENRCFALTRGVICLVCGYKETCSGRNLLDRK